MYRIFVVMKKAPVVSTKGKRGASRRKTVKAVTTDKLIKVADKPILITQDDADNLFEDIVVPTNNTGLITNGFDAKGLSKLLVDADDRFTVATCEASAYQFMHCIAEMALEAVAAQGSDLNDNGTVSLIHTLKSDFEANKHTLKRGAITTQKVNAGQARKHHAAKASERFRAKV